MKSRYKRTSSTYMHLQLYEMYKSGSSFDEIADKFDISCERAEDYVASYMRKHKIDRDKIEANREVIKTITTSLETNYTPTTENSLESEIACISKTYLDSDLETRLPEPHLSWFDKIKLAIYHFFLFWK